MTYLPGTPDGIYPGRCTARAVIEDDQHLVVLDVSGHAYPLDGLLATLARTLADVGLVEEFVVLARNRTSDLRCSMAEQALRSEPSVARCLQITMTVDEADRLRAELDEATLERDACTFPGCHSLRVDADFCAAHLLDVA